MIVLFSRLRGAALGVLPGSALFLVLAAVLSGCGGEQNPPASRPPPDVTVATPVVKRITEWDEYTGRFEATQTVEVRARVSGYLEQINFKPGQMVEQGMILFVIDQRPFQAALEAARADVKAAEAQLALAMAEFERAKPLRERGTISASVFDERAQQRNVAAAALEGAKANLRQAELNLEFTEVKAPISGRVSRDNVSIGNLVTGGSVNATLLTNIVSLDPIYFNFTVSESAFLKYVRLSKSGSRPSSRDNATPVWVKLADEEEYKRQGVMDFVDNRLSDRSGTILGRAVFENDDRFLTPGLFGRLRLPGSGEYEAVLIPDSAILRDQTKSFVYVIKDDDTAEARTIKTGPLVDGLRVVRSGLEGQDRFVTAGLQRVRPGQPVTPDLQPIASSDE